ncbi:MAG: DUF58 domain-containing protein [Myxococcales bacterium]|nr:DUF58 domain-containing protein [Myxococcales bacterium]
MLTKEDLREIRKIEIITNRLVNDQLAGSYHSVFKGRGMSFDEVRLYQPGDEIRLIDWNVSARTNEVYVKQFVEERELTVLILVDMSGSLDFGTKTETKRKMAAKLAALLAFSAIKNNDRIGLVLFTDQVERFVPPKKGRKHVLRIISEIIAYEPERRGTDIAVSLQYLMGVTKRRTVAFLISDFLNEGFEKALRIASQRHDIVPIVLTDLMEQTLPDMGYLWVEDPETGEILVAPTSARSFRTRFHNQASVRAAQLDTMFRRLRIDSIRVRTGEPYTKPLMNYFKLRAKRM